MIMVDRVTGMRTAFGDIPIVADPTVPRDMARIGGRLFSVGATNTAAWTAGAVAYPRRVDAERGLAREPDRDHVWIARIPGQAFRVSARATALRPIVTRVDWSDLGRSPIVDPLPPTHPRSLIIGGVV